MIGTKWISKEWRKRRTRQTARLGEHGKLREEVIDVRLGSIRCGQGDVIDDVGLIDNQRVKQFPIVMDE